MQSDIIFSTNLYLGDSINPDKVEKIKRKLVNRPLFAGVIVIALSQNSSDQLEFYEAKQLQQRYYRHNPPCIIGIAKDKAEAISIIQQIVEECLNARGDCALKEYLQC